ncbi:MAG TPA: hypothetical protein VK665_08535 [Candidatus Elarobacter sp.]|nr:hypothetical protein [Candidatus Elarobacter sp.]
MKHPIEITIDPEWPIVYVRYLSGDVEHDGSLTLLRDADGVVRDHAFCDVDYRWDGVHIDVTPNDEIIGFEIIHVDNADAVGMAREYATANGLAFPDDLRAAAARSPAA